MSSDANLKRVSYIGLAAAALALALASYALYKIRPLAAGDDQPITVAGGSIKLETDEPDPWNEGQPNGYQELTYNQSKPYDNAITNLGQIELRGKDSDGKDFDYLAYRDPNSALRIELAFSKQFNQYPITTVILESPERSSALRDAFKVTVVGPNHHKFKYKKIGLREIDEYGWKIQKVSLKSGLIAVPGTPALPTEIQVEHQHFYMRLHDCPLDPKKTDGSCRP